MMKNLTAQKICLVFACLFFIINGNAQVNKQLEKSSTNYCLCQNQDSINNTTIENTASKRILDIGMNMALISKTIIIGSCWEFVNEVYKRAGVSSSKKTVFKSKLNGPYANPILVKPGDWVYHINKSYNNIEHSAIFVCWKDFEKKLAITLSYAGRNRSVPANYGTYDLSDIFAIFRPIE
jgi:hypothetical protein